MRLLLTRAAEDAARTRAKLEAAGHHVLVSPVIAICATGAAWPTGALDAIAATSAHAFARLIDGPAPESRRLLPLLLVGEKTAAAARDAGFLGAASTAPNAATLAASLPRLARGARVLYLAGADRKPDLDAAAREAGLVLEVLEIYRAAAATVLEEEARTALARGAVDAVLHFSRRSASLFLQLARDAGLPATSQRHVCLSEDVVAPLREAGCAEVIVADAPHEASLLAAIKK